MLLDTPVQTGHILYKLNRRHCLHIIINIGIGGKTYALETGRYCGTKKTIYKRVFKQGLPNLF